MHKLFTLDDLYDFYSKQGKTCNFSSNESNSTIIVHVRDKMKFSSDYDPTFNLLPTHLKSCHLFENRNQSSISESAMKEAIPSFYNRPILGYIQKIEKEDGTFEYDFAGHEMTVDDEGNLEYLEAVVGVIPESCKPELVYDEDKDKTYLEVNGYIYEDYTHAADILRRKGECDVSVEIAVDELSYSADTKVLNIDKFHFMGVTILGVTTNENHQKVSPGMDGANITIADFSAENNSLTFNREELIDEIITAVMSRLNDKQNSKEGGNAVEKFENLLEKYGKTVEDITFDYEGMSDEELEQKFAELFDAAEGDPSEDGGEPNGAGDGNGEGESAKEFSVSASVQFGERTIEFSRSLQDTIGALTELVNNTYAETDNEYYDVDVYDEDKYVIMKGYWSGKAYKQSYKVKKDVFTLTGDRTSVRAMFLTDLEIAELDKMRANYSEISEKLEKYEATEELVNKQNLMNSSDYASISDKEDFAELKKSVEDGSNAMTFEELRAKADNILLTYAKSGDVSPFEPGKAKTVDKKQFANPKRVKKNRYGSLFKNID